METKQKLCNITRKDFEFNEFNELMQLKQIPHFGVYSDEYIFFMPINTLFKKNPQDSFFFFISILTAKMPI
jgi:hypothetical protein